MAMVSYEGGRGIEPLRCGDAVEANTPRPFARDDPGLAKAGRRDGHYTEVTEGRSSQMRGDLAIRARPSGFLHLFRRGWLSAR
jgi:hypothetical protein